MTDPMILCADPEPSARTATVSALREGFEPYAVEGLASFSEAKRTLDERGAECVVSEYVIGGATGFELFAHARRIEPDTVCVLFTGTPTTEIETEPGVICDYVGKARPSARETLRKTIATSFAYRSHTAYPLPTRENARLDALGAVDADDPAFRAFATRLTERAAEHFDVPFAYASVIRSHQQEHLACAGFEPGTMHRENAICTYTILDDGVTVIEDVPDDPRFADEDYVADFGLQWYAGAPVTTPDGFVLGTFCLLDTAPRGFDAADRADLERFAEETSEELLRHVADAA